MYIFIYKLYLATRILLCEPSLNSTTAYRQFPKTSGEMQDAKSAENVLLLHSTVLSFLHSKHVLNYSEGNKLLYFRKNYVFFLKYNNLLPSE